MFPLKPGDEIEVNGKSFTIDSNGLTFMSKDIQASKYVVQVTSYDMFGNEIKSDMSVFDRDKSVNNK